MRAAIVILCAACASTGGGKAEPERPDEKTLAMETLVRAQSATLVLSADWRAEAKLTGAAMNREPGGSVETARGNAVFALRALRVEADDTIKVTWLADHENLLVSARGVELFSQKRDRPYMSEDLAMVTMANDQVSFFKQ